MLAKEILNKLNSEVINSGNCFHCGLCEGLTDGLFKMKQTIKGPIPTLLRDANEGDQEDLKKIYLACPGRSIPYSFLQKKISSKQKSRFIGNYNNLYIASAIDESIRIKGSSGGVIRLMLLNLIKNKEVDYVIILDQDLKNPLINKPIITNSIRKINNVTQSVYETVPLLQIIKKLKKKKKYCLVALPEQIAAVRILKLYYKKQFQNIKFLIGLYSGTNMYQGALKFYLKKNGVSKLNQIKKLDWRYGEWPGSLRIKTSKKEFLIKKFYYNYLIPLYISKNCLLTPDLSSELSDISVGDAWSPKLEKSGYGYSLVISRSLYFDNFIKKLLAKKKISIKKVSHNFAVGLHAHMIDFKKVGSFIRINLLNNFKFPRYDYNLHGITNKRIFIEKIILIIINLSSSNLGRIIFRIMPESFLGFIFEKTRSIWKYFSKSIKREGLKKVRFSSIENLRVKELKLL